ncbi:ras association domain-containing protein 1-like isoform X2 [Xenia sp. Carnegie-2017]|uniref:ras association domain-containing protein 1-like isoform X2 n=1 Tax=Xenia sp. Carnegie-2017 TaxID=2897299 RepID=UPI001F041AF8|nr:ras association domain-containing protein 1-like isoform X2 [Xenia sp. Carnegie-2017]
MIRECNLVKVKEESHFYGCNYTCHYRCKDEVVLECDGGLIRDAKEMTREEITLKTLEILSQGKVKKNAPAVLPTDLSADKLLLMIEDFNKSSQGLIMTTASNVANDGIFEGFIRVAMNLLRPINIVAGERPLSIFETVSWRREGSSTSSKRTKTSFFLPPNTMKALHITSETTAAQVIVDLLKKYKISDHPRKFALYERYQDDDNVTLRRITDNERPLVLRLIWGGADRSHSFVLQENETGDIMWEAFSIPELQNFIRILEMEEKEYIKRVFTKYRVYRDQLEEVMAERKAKSTTNFGKNGEVCGIEFIGVKPKVR